MTLKDRAILTTIERSGQLFWMLILLEPFVSQQLQLSLYLRLVGIALCIIVLDIASPRFLVSKTSLNLSCFVAIYRSGDTHTTWIRRHIVTKMVTYWRLLFCCKIVWP